MQKRRISHRRDNYEITRIFMSYDNVSCDVRLFIPGVGPAGCGHSKLARARTGLPQTSVQLISVTKVVTKSVKKKGNEFFAKASETEIWTRVCRRYLTSFAGLHFENEPGLTELYAAEGRRNRRLCVSKRGNGGNTIAMWL